jgi:hypothetical protein
MPLDFAWAEALKQSGGEAAQEVTENHIKVHRSWGSYQSVDNRGRHQG